MLSFHLRLSKRQSKALEKKSRQARREGNLTAFLRAQTILLVSEDVPISKIASLLKICAQTIRTWIFKYILFGVSFLFYRRRSPGRRPKLTKTQKKQLCKIIDKGPAKAGFLGNCWRSPMIQELIRQEFGVFYSVKYISQLLNNLGYSYQKATFESDHLDRKKRKEWLEKKWPEILEKAKEKDAMILFEDEASFPQWGTLSRTWAKKGRKVKIKTTGKRKGYKVFGAIEYFTGQFFYKCIEERFKSETYIPFLEEILSHTKKHIILIHDGAPYHKSKALKMFYDSQRDRLTVHRLPSYSPDYNPIEKLWKKIKEKGTHLHYFPTFESLKNKVRQCLVGFENTKEEVLSLFLMYNKLEDALR